MKTPPLAHIRLAGASAALAAALLVFDLSVPLGLAGGVPYVLLVALALWSPWHRYIYLMAAVGTALTVVGYFASPEGGPPWIVLTNRGLALLVIWVTALLGAYIQASRVRLRAIVDTAAEAIITIDSRGIIQSFNKAAETIFGHSAEEAVGRNVSMLMPSPECESHDRYISDYLKGGAAKCIGRRREVTGRRKDGSAFPMELLVSEVRLGGRRTFTGIMRDCTEPKRAEEALRGSEQRFRALYDDNPSMYFTLDGEGTILSVNRFGADQLGFAVEELVGDTVLKIFDDDHKPAAGGHLRTCLSAPGKVHRWEILKVRKDGTEMWVEETARAVEQPGGEPIVFVVCEDITERKRAEDALQESEERFRATFEQAAVGIDQCAPDGRYLRVNQRLCEITGYGRDEMLGRRCQNITHPDDLKADLEQKARVLAGEIRTGVMEKRYVRKDGSVVWVNRTITVVRDPGGHPHYLLSVIEDITERKQAEVALRESEQRIRAIMDNVADAVVTIDEEGRIESFNPAAESLFGYKAVEVIGRNVGIVAPEPEHSRHDGYIRRYLDTGKARILGTGPRELVACRKDGSTFPMELAVSEMFLGDRRTFIGTMHDLTDRKAMDEQLREAQKMEAVGQLTGGIAHDFNNLLSVILGNTELLAEHVEEDERGRKFAGTVRTAALRAAELTQKLLAFSRRQPLHPEVIDLGKLVSGMTGMLRRTLGEMIEVETLIPEGLWRTRADPGQVENALLNLAINARDAMPKGGSLIIETANIRLSKKAAAKHTDAAPGDYVMLVVADTGSGMPAEVLERVFEPFFTTKEVGKGTGLGLSMVYGFAIQSGGFADIASTPGKGTRVELYLPKAEVGEEAAAEGAVTGEQRAGEGETILVVEDDKNVRDVAVTLLTSLGYQIVEAENGPAALSLLESGEPIDLLFTDLVMPAGMNGRELAHEARRRNPGLKVLFTTGYTGETLYDGGEIKEGAGLIPKPYAKKQLARAIREALGGPLDGA
ncbi:MAG: PAS domain S-box protein [Alphaproteobacteria bacterium]